MIQAIVPELIHNPQHLPALYDEAAIAREHSWDITTTCRPSLPRAKPTAQGWAHVLRICSMPPGICSPPQQPDEHDSHNDDDDTQPLPQWWWERWTCIHLLFEAVRHVWDSWDSPCGRFCVRDHAGRSCLWLSRTR